MPNLSDKDKEHIVNLTKEGNPLPKEVIYQMYARVRLKDFTTSYTQDDLDQIEQNLKNGRKSC
jgi:hypothetical protein